jgi:trimethylamine---corrinoid protein Co-methyltransferase
MIHPSIIENRSVFFRALSDDQVWAIKRTALEILEKIGAKILHAGAVEMLKKAGAVVKGERVKIPQHIVAACLQTAPKGFTIYDRQGRRAMEVESRKSYYGSSTASPNTKDAYTGEIHPTRVEDIAIGARVTDALAHIDYAMPMGSCQDVESITADVHEFFAVVSNTTKPIVFIGYSPQGFEMVYEMAAEVVGGLDNLKERPFLIAYPEPISPLVFPAEVVDRMFIAADLGMPQIPGPAVRLGATGPMTLAGTVAQVIAEGLLCLTIVQLRKPGAPCFLSGNVSTLDMSTGTGGGQAPEVSLGFAAQAQVAQSWGLPTWGLAGSTVAKTLDAQAGIEAAFSILAQGLAGLNLIHDVGYMDNAMVCSTEMLVMGDEIIGMAKRFVGGIEVNTETLALEVIESVGPGGHFLQEEHTLRHFRKELWVPKLITRLPYNTWQEHGSKSMAQRVHERVREILEAHRPTPLSDEIYGRLEQMKRRNVKKLSGN